MAKRAFKSSVVKHPLSSSLQMGLALPGAGIHGAFTWGALDTLFGYDAYTNGDICFPAVTGSSSGTLNAVTAFQTETPEEQRAHLGNLWADIQKNISSADLMHQFGSMASGLMFGARWPNLDPIALEAAKTASRFAKEQTTQSVIDHCGTISDWQRFEKGPTKVFAAASRKNSDGHLTLEVFHEELSPEHVAASCAMWGYKDQWWDGACTRNTVFAPLIEMGLKDIIVISPFDPASDIVEAVSQNRYAGSKDFLITHQIHSHVAYLQMLHPDIRFHVFTPDHPEHWDETAFWNPSTRLVLTLKDVGRNGMRAWLDENQENFGVRSTLPYGIQTEACMLNLKHAA